MCQPREEERGGVPAPEVAQAEQQPPAGPAPQEAADIDPGNDQMLDAIAENVNNLATEDVLPPIQQLLEMNQHIQQLLQVIDANVQQDEDDVDGGLGSGPASVGQSQYSSAGGNGSVLLDMTLEDSSGDDELDINGMDSNSDQASNDSDLSDNDDEESVVFEIDMADNMDRSISPRLPSSSSTSMSTSADSNNPKPGNARLSTLAEMAIKRATAQARGELTSSVDVTDSVRFSNTIPFNLARCVVCPSSSAYICGECRRVGYCSEVHQTEDWTTHRDHCQRLALYRPPAVEYWGPYKIVRNVGKEGFGMLTACDVPMGTKILVEKPFLICPWPRTLLRGRDTQEMRKMKFLAVRCMTCFGCCKYIGFNSVECSNCALPICSLQCKQYSNHSENECKFIKEIHENKPLDLELDTSLRRLVNEDVNRINPMEMLYTDVMILRLVLKISEIAKKEGVETQHETWAKLCSKWNFDENSRMKKSTTGKGVFDLINIYLPISMYATKSNKAFVWKLFCIVSSNSFKFDLPYRRYSVLCTVLNQARHSCAPNCHAFLEEPEGNEESEIEDIKVVVRAGNDLLKNQYITFSYCPLVIGTLHRRPILLDTYLFWCNCHRCLDPTECGTYMSSLICVSCLTGHLSPPVALLQLTPDSPKELELEAVKKVWICDANINRRCNRITLAPSANSTSVSLLKTKEYEMESIVTVGNYKMAYGYLLSSAKGFASSTKSQRLRPLPDIHYVNLMLAEDILRGALFPHAEFTKESLNEFDLHSLVAMREAELRYKTAMSTLSPGFRFEGFPKLAIDMMINECHIPKSVDSPPPEQHNTPVPVASNSNGLEMVSLGRVSEDDLQYARVYHTSEGEARAHRISQTLTSNSLTEAQRDRLIQQVMAVNAQRAALNQNNQQQHSSSNTPYGVYISRNAPPIQASADSRRGRGSVNRGGTAPRRGGFPTRNSFLDHM